MNTTTLRKSPADLTTGDRVIYRREVGTFVGWTGWPRETTYGVFRTARIVNADGYTVFWSIDLHGTV